MARQAVVVIHGMGEQVPLGTLTGFIDAALTPDTKHQRLFYSRPERVTGSFESRCFLAPEVEWVGEGEAWVRPKTEFFEYHWADKMQGNRLDDLWPTFRRMMWCDPRRVPAGLTGAWAIAWLLILWLSWAVGWGPLSGVWRNGDDFGTSLVGALVSGAFASAVLSYLFSRLLPSWLTASFVDVVRYLDTSPRSYGVRREIRKGLVEMLQALHAKDGNGRQRYDRIVIVAHSLGAYIAYDAISYLWGLTSSQTLMTKSELTGLNKLEEAADAMEKGTGNVKDFQCAQNALFRGLRATGNPWLITDFVSVGAPMYFADRLMPGKGEVGFNRRKDRFELTTCPPMVRQPPDHNHTRYSYCRNKTYQVLHESAPFTVVRWTNLFFPTSLGFLGDWFGDRLSPLFGAGIRDVPIVGNKPQRYVPAWPHSLYFRYPEDTTPGSATAELRTAMALRSEIKKAPTKRTKTNLVAPGNLQADRATTRASLDPAVARPE